MDSQTYFRIKRRVFEIVEVDDKGNVASAAFDWFIITLIVMNILMFMLETIPDLPALYLRWLHVFDVFSLLIFTVEYVVRLWSCTSEPAYSHPVRGRLKFATKPLLILDLLAILPFYLPFVPLDLRFLRALRVLRVLRVLKLARYFESLRLLGRILLSKKEEIIVSLGIILTLMFMAASLIFVFEHPVHPDEFPDMFYTLWWAAVSLTVGHGTYPTTVIGRVLYALIALLGVGIFAIPTGIIASGFMEYIAKKKECVCPKCNTPCRCEREISLGTESHLEKDRPLSG